MAVLAFLFIGLGKIIKFIFKYLTPVLLCGIAVIGGIVTAALTLQQHYGGWLSNISSQYSHTVTIWWDEERGIKTTIFVREDQNWDINGTMHVRGKDGSLDDTPSYCKEFLSVELLGEDPSVTQFMPEPYMAPDLPQEAHKDGFAFLGLFSSPFGGTQFVNGAGYSLRRVTMDLDLYALWQEL